MIELREVPCVTPQPPDVRCYMMRVADGDEVSVMIEFNQSLARWYISVSGNGRPPTILELVSARDALLPTMRMHKTRPITNPYVVHLFELKDNERADDEIPLPLLEE